MNIMTRAWEIAKEGASKFGGSVKAYFAVALEMAWIEFKNAPKDYIEQLKNVYVNYGFGAERVVVTFKEWKRNTELHRLYINIESNKGKSLNTLFIQMLDGKVGVQGKNATLKSLGEVAANIVEANKHEILAKYVA